MKNISDEARERIRQGSLKSTEVRIKKLHDAYNNNPSKCTNCDLILDYSKRHNKFCSQSCAATFNNSKFIKRKTKYIKSEFCINCNKSIKDKIAGQKYCCSKCQQEYQTNLKIQPWINDKQDNISIKTIKKYLLKECNYKCQCCGWGEVNIHTNNVPLEIHHIDGNSENNTKENLLIICPNCHSLTVNYKNANKNSNREYRKKYYNYQSGASEEI